MAIDSDFRSGIAQVIDLYGETCKVSDTAGVTRDVFMAVLQPEATKENEQIVNSIGLSGRIFYMKSNEMGLQKYDRVTVPSTGLTYTIQQDSIALTVRGNVIGHEAMGK